MLARLSPCIQSRRLSSPTSPPSVLPRSSLRTGVFPILTRCLTLWTSVAGCEVGDLEYRRLSDTHPGPPLLDYRKFTIVSGLYYL